MKALRYLSLCCLFAVACITGAQSVGRSSAAATKSVVPAKVSLYTTGATLDYTALLPPPPVADSEAARDDLEAVRVAEETRTPAQIRSAQQDDKEESIFIYTALLGPHFIASELPITALFSQHLRTESSVVNPSLKLAFHRPRPFVADASLHPICEKTASNSYPSGHSMVGYLEGFALAQMVPEQRTAILARARAYAQNRVICGVHYPSDVEASRTVALALFGALSASPRFQQELQASRSELRKRLDLPSTTP